MSVQEQNAQKQKISNLEKEVLVSENKKNQETFETFYTSTPTEEGNFYDELITKEYKKNISLFKITMLNQENTKAKIQFLDDDKTLKIAFNVYESAIKPICTSKMAFNMNKHKGIIPLEQGTMVKKGKMWCPDKKILIDYYPSLKEESLEEKSNEIFYLSTPNKDGSFNADSVRETFTYGASIYKFTKISDDKAKFKIDSNEGSIKLALAFPNSNIQPSCEEQNAYTKNVKEIITEEDGEAKLKGNKWKIVKPAKIRYE